MANNLFKKATKLEAAYLKMGFYGKNGTGKTFTASRVAIGLYQYIKATKPIFFLDSETGSDYVLPMFKEAGIELQVAKSRAFADLLTAIDVAEKDGSILLTDSVTHFWDDIVESYKRKKGVKHMGPRNWGELKPEWRVFSEKFVASNLHVIVCGRSGDIWQDVEDQDGAKELKIVGTRMRVEKELGYEPSLLVEMELAPVRVDGKQTFTHRAWVQKDRFNTLTFKPCDDPGFDFFLPHIELLNLGGKHRALDVGRDSQELFDNDNSGAEYYKKHDILIEKIEDAIYELIPGSTNSVDVKTARIKLSKEVFGTTSRKEIELMKNDKLEKCLATLEQRLNPKNKKEKSK